MPWLVQPSSHGPTDRKSEGILSSRRAVFDGQLRMERVGGQFMLKLLRARNCTAVQGNDRSWTGEEKGSANADYFLAPSKRYQRSGR